MRITLLADAFLPYICGATTHTVELAIRLLAEGHRVQICTPGKTLSSPLPATLEGTEIVHLPSVPTFIKDLRVVVASAPRLLPALRTFAPDIIESQVPSFLGIEGLAFAKILHIPFVTTFHTLFTAKEYLKQIFRTDGAFLEKTSWAYHKWYFQSADKVFVGTSAIKTMLIGKGISPGHIALVPILTDAIAPVLLSESQKLQLKKKLRLNKHVALYLGRISEEKNIAGLLQAWKLVAGKRTDVSLLCIGSGTYETKAKQFIYDYKLQNTVRLHGSVKHRELISSGILSIADIYVSLSQTETLGLSGIEAAAHGLPLVVADTPVNKLLFGAAARYIPAANPSVCAVEISRLFADDKRCIQLGLQARQVAHAYHARTNRQPISRVYEQVMREYRADE